MGVAGCLLRVRKLLFARWLHGLCILNAWMHLDGGHIRWLNWFHPMGGGVHLGAEKAPAHHRHSLVPTVEGTGSVPSLEGLSLALTWAQELPVGPTERVLVLQSWRYVSCRNGRGSETEMPTQAVG